MCFSQFKYIFPCRSAFLTRAALLHELCAFLVRQVARGGRPPRPLQRSALAEPNSVGHLACKFSNIFNCPRGNWIRFKFLRGFIILPTLFQYFRNRILFIYLEIHDSHDAYMCSHYSPISRHVGCCYNDRGLDILY